LITDLLTERAVDNLEATYLAVGKQGDGAWIDSWDGGAACLSTLGHPVSNFAVVRRISIERARILQDFAFGRRAFNVYLCCGEHQAENHSILEKLGFSIAGHLVVMIGDGARKLGSQDLNKVEQFEQRLSVGRFMARQFFARQTSSLRESIALATAKAPVELYVQENRQILAAAMVFRTVGMAGIYNVCVSDVERERGHGSSLLASLLEIADRAKLLATLQCEPNLEPWYLKRGFHSVGSVSVLTLDRKASHAIM
jgi:N-acetylglutamate synthase-like GNAT family acetyltransferase